MIPTHPTPRRLEYRRAALDAVLLSRHTDRLSAFLASPEALAGANPSRAFADSIAFSSSAPHTREVSPVAITFAGWYPEEGWHSSFSLISMPS